MPQGENYGGQENLQGLGEAELRFYNAINVIFTAKEELSVDDIVRALLPQGAKSETIERYKKWLGTFAEAGLVTIQTRNGVRYYKLINKI